MELETIKAGDLVAPMVKGMSSGEERWNILHIVKSVSPKRFVVAGSTVEKATGREVGKFNHRTRWVIATPEMIALHESRNAEYVAREQVREERNAAESRIEITTKEIIAFARALSEDKRTLPWFETARQLISKLDRDAAIAKVS